MDITSIYIQSIRGTILPLINTVSRTKNQKTTKQIGIYFDTAEEIHKNW